LAIARPMVRVARLIQGFHLVLDPGGANGETGAERGQRPPEGPLGVGAWLDLHRCLGVLRRRVSACPLTQGAAMPFRFFAMATRLTSGPVWPLACGERLANPTPEPSEPSNQRR